MANDCLCAQVFGSSCPADAPADCRVVYRHTILRCTSECLYALLDTDQCERPDLSKPMPGKRAGQQQELPIGGR